MLLTCALVTKIIIFLKQVMLYIMQNLNVNTWFENLSATCLHYAFTCTCIQVLLSKMVVKIVNKHDSFDRVDLPGNVSTRW